MKFLFRRQRNNSVLKLYRIVTADQARLFDTKTFIVSVLEYFDSVIRILPSDYYVTGPYPSRGWRTANAFLRDLEKRAYKDICHLLLSAERYSFSYENWSLNETQPRPLDSQSVVFSVSEESADLAMLEDLALSLGKVFPFQYGYLLSLPSDFNPISERRNNKDTVLKEDTAWLKNLQKISDGQIRNVYPVNFINESLVSSAKFKELIVDPEIGNFEKTDLGLYKWTLTLQEISVAKEKFKGTNSILVES